MAKRGARAVVYTTELDAVRHDQVDAVWDDTSYEVRRDGPKEMWERPNSPSGRNVTGEAVKRSYMQQMEDLACSQMLWVPSEGIDRYLEEQAAGQPALGRPRQFGTADFLLFEFAARVWGGYRAAERNLADRKNYKRLRKAVRRAWSDHPERRLSTRGLTRSQHYRFRKKLLKVRHRNGKPVLLALLRQIVVLMSLQGALHIGLFDRMRGSVTNPDTTQAIVGDATWLPSMYSNPPPGQLGHNPNYRWDPDVRHKPGKGNAYGHMAVLTIARNPHRNERVILACDLKPKGKSDATVFTDVILDILDRYPDLTPGVRAAVYDMALRSQNIDRLQDHGLHPIVKTPRTNKGKTAALTLGHHTFKQPEAKTSESRPVIAIHGTPTLELTDGDGHKIYQHFNGSKPRSKSAAAAKRSCTAPGPSLTNQSSPPTSLAPPPSSVTTAPHKNVTANPTDAAPAHSQPFPNPTRSSNPSTESVKTPNPPTANSNIFCPTAGSAPSGKTESYSTSSPSKSSPLTLLW